MSLLFKLVEATFNRDYMSTRYSSFNLFSFQWGYEDENTTQGLQCIIKVFGWNEKNESVYVRVEDFQLPIYISLPEDIDWTETRIMTLCHRLQTMNPNVQLRPKTICYEDKQRSYYAYVERVKEEKGMGLKYAHKKFPFLLALFSNTKACDSFTGALRREVTVTGLGRVKLQCHATARTITPVLKYLGVRQVPSAGWMIGKGIKLTKSEKESTRMHEYCVSFDALTAMTEEEAMRMPIVLPKIMSFDNEANSTIMSSMPKAFRPDDKTFQIGFIILDPPKNGKPRILRKELLTMGKPNPIEDVLITTYPTEADLYVGFTEKMRKEDPDVVLGFNILGWDINYMLERCQRYCRCTGEFDMMGCIEGRHAPVGVISWGSSAYGKQEFNYLDADGRIFVDMLPYIKRNYKLHNYRMETCCDELLKTHNKDPVKPKEIFKTYRYMKDARANPDDQEKQAIAGRELARVGKYCVQDAFVCLLLYEKLNTWFDLVESGTVNNVPIFAMYTAGQQIKIYSQVYRYAFHHNIVVESDAFHPTGDEHYTGAYVSEPIKGLYDRIVPFDFSSLYPSLMMAYNIDFQKLVVDPTIPDEDCHVMSWCCHYYCRCPKDEFPGKKAPKMKDGKLKQVCAEYKYRWLKHSVSGKGILPTLLENLLGARKKTRRIIAGNEAEIKMLKKALNQDQFSEEEQSELKNRIKYYEDKREEVPTVLIQIKEIAPNEGEIKLRIEYLESLNIVLDRRQNAYKVNANSCYGSLGSSRGYLPFLPGAMCVTYSGRMNIHKANAFIEGECGGKVIYNDTDSAYCYFEAFKDKTIPELWAYAESIVKRIKSIFPPELSLEFEAKIYVKFLILTKKRYIAESADQTGKSDSKLLKRGVVLQRRDNCIILREVYQSLILTIFKHHNELVKLKDVKDQREIMDNPIVKDLLNMIVFAIDTLFQWKYGFKHFTITKQITRDVKEYKNPNRLPGHVLLGVKMKNRGVPVAAGTRVEYVIIKNKVFKKSDAQKDKLEDVNYFAEFREILRLSFLDYLKQFINPIDEICEVVMGIKGFVKGQFEQRIKYSKVVDRIAWLGAPKFKFESGPRNRFMEFED